VSVDFKIGEGERDGEGCAFFFPVKKMAMGTKLVGHFLTKSSKVIPPVIGEVALEYARKLCRDPRTQVTKEGTTWSPYLHLARTGSIVTRVSLSEQRLELLARTHLRAGWGDFEIRTEIYKL